MGDVANAIGTVGNRCRLPSSYHPGGGRGPSGKVVVTERRVTSSASPNWAPASAGVVASLAGFRDLLGSSGYGGYGGYGGYAPGGHAP